MEQLSVLPTKSVAPSLLRRVALPLVAIPLVCFVALLLTYTVNVPWMDDLDAFLNFIIGYTDARTTAEKLDWLLRPNNEHRILIAKLITLGMYDLTGEVNFRGLIFCAFVFLAGILGLFYWVFRSMKLPLLAFAPVPFFLLQPQHYLTSIWAITGLQHQVVVFLTFSAIYLLAGRGRERFAGATVLQLLASLSMSNGLFGWVAGAVVLAMQQHWRRLGIWLAIGIVTIVFYFHDFSSPQGNETSFSFFLKYPYLVFSGFFTFTGALFDFFPGQPIFWRSVLPTLAGLVVIPMMLWFLWQMNWETISFRRSGGSGWSSVGRPEDVLQKRRYFFTGCYAFLMVNAVIVAFLRPRFGYNVMLVSNYMLYPAVLVVLLYLNGLSEFRVGRTVTQWFRIGLVLSVLVWGVSYMRHWPKVSQRRQMLLSFAFDQQHNQVGLGATPGTPFADMARQVINETIRRGMYNYPAETATLFEPVLRPATRTLPPDPLLKLERVDNDYSTVVQTANWSPPAATRQAYVVAVSDRWTFLFPTESYFSPGPFFLNRPVPGLRAEVIRGMLHPGTYRIGMLILPGNTQPVRFSNQTITVP